MARTDPTLSVKVPQFVHDDLDNLVEALEDEDASETSLVGALIHAATVAAARTALRTYKKDVVAYRRARRSTAPD